MYREVMRCRICGNSDLIPVLDLGEQYLTGVFPSKVRTDLGKGPVQLVKCFGTSPRDFCGLVQLRHSFPAEQMYGETYGYRSGLNQAMVRHLHEKVHYLRQLVELGADDLVLDIGSNDGTLLGGHPEGGPFLIGIDPSAEKFRKFYRPDITVVIDFFSKGVFGRHFGDRKAKLVTSIAMFYDLDDPFAFASAVASILSDDGIWHLEQSYLPSMLRANSYDTVCHEHIEYYALRQLDWIFERAGLRIIDVRVNDVNGGSFAVTVAKAGYKRCEQTAVVDELRAAEAALALDTLQPFRGFERAAAMHREKLLRFFDGVHRSGKRVLGYGASTKGNVLLQFCGITPEMLPCIAEVNEDKFGCYTPGTWIPIVPEARARGLNPDFLFVLPWHFRKGIIERERVLAGRRKARVPAA